MKTRLILDYLFNKSHGICYICGRAVMRSKPSWMTDAQWRRLMPTKDHVIPKSAGGGIGKMGLTNVRLAHAECNAAKGSEPAQLFRMEQLMLHKFPTLEGDRLVYHYNEDGNLKAIYHTG